MRDAVDLIGKIIHIESITYEIEKIYFVPESMNQEQDIYFGLRKPNGCSINFSYKSLLPHIKQQIKL
jgi:hypothetical protein